MEDSEDTWKYYSVLCKFVLNFIDISISKSFGVLIPVMIHVLSTNTRTLGFVCSLPSAFMFVSCLVVAYALKMSIGTPRKMALLGALLSSVCLITTAFITSVPLLGVCLSLTGIGMSMGFQSSKIMLNEYFKKSYVLVASIANFGNTTAALISPVIVERALEAYGYNGALLILAGICMHAIPAGATMRKPRKMHGRRNEVGYGQEMQDLMPDTGEGDSPDTDIETGQVAGLEDTPKESDSNSFSNPNTCGRSEPTLTQNIKRWFLRCIFIQEPLFTISLPCDFFVAFGTISWVLFLVPKAEWHGIPSSKAVLLSSIAGAGGIVGRLFFIAFIYFGANAIFLACIFNTLSAITFFLDPLITTFHVMCLVAFIQGWCVFCCGIAVSANPKYAVSDENFGVATGFYGLFAGLGSVLGGFISGLIKDTSNSFTTAFLVIGGVYAICGVTSFLFLISYRRKLAMNSSENV